MATPPKRGVRHVQPTRSLIQRKRPDVADGSLGCRTAVAGERVLTVWPAFRAKPGASGSGRGGVRVRTNADPYTQGHVTCQAVPPPGAQVLSFAYLRRRRATVGTEVPSQVDLGGHAVSQNSERRTLTNRRDLVIEIVRSRGLLKLPEPVELASGELSRDFIDGKAALARGQDLQIACEALIDSVGDIPFDAVGGLTMGADQFAHVVAVLAAKEWFVVRKEPKGRGTNKLVEGAAVSAGTRVLLVDDVVTTGGSIQKAYEVIISLGATVVAAVTLVDRGEVAARFFRQKAIPYFPLVTYRDLGIEAVGGGLVRT